MLFLNNIWLYMMYMMKPNIYLMYPKPFMTKVLKQQCFLKKHKEPLYLILQNTKTFKTNYAQQLLVDDMQ